MPNEPEEVFNVFVQWVSGQPDALDERSVYTVNVKYQPNNPIHAAILQTGFDNGSYAAILSQGDTYSPRKYHHIEVVEKLTEMPSHGPFRD
jgi:hypothetical protein